MPRPQGDGRGKLQRQERVPIIFGTQGPQTLALAGRVSDGVVLSSFTTVPMVRGAVRTLRDAAAAAGRAADEVVVTRLVAIAVTGNPTEYLEQMRPIIARELSIPGRGEAILEGTPWSPEILRAIRAALRTEELAAKGLEPYRWALRVGDVAAAAGSVPPELVAAMAIAGPAGYCRDRLEELAEAGVDRAVLTTPLRLADVAAALLA